MQIARLEKDAIAQWFEIGPAPADPVSAGIRIASQVASHDGFGTVRFLARDGAGTAARIAVKIEPRGRVQLWPPVFHWAMSARQRRQVAAGFLAEAAALGAKAPIRYLEARFGTTASDEAVWRQALHAFGFRFVADAAILERPTSAAEPPAAIENIVRGDHISERALLDLYLACQSDTADRADADPSISVRDDFTDFLAPAEPTADRALWHVVIAEAKPVGLVIPEINLAAGSGWIAYIGVVPKYRRLGIGQALLRTTILAVSNVVQTLRVMIDRENRYSLALHCRNGFRATGEHFLTYRAEMAARSEKTR